MQYMDGRAYSKLNYQQKAKQYVYNKEQTKLMSMKYS